MAICPKCQRESGDVLDPCPSGDGYFCIDEDEYYSHNDDRLLGRKVADRFIIQSVLGRGSMSRVYEAHQGQVDRSVALKVFQPETILGRDRSQEADHQERSRAEARFVQEAQVLGKLTHPNCVTVYDFGLDEDGQFLYMAMEYVAGVSLRTAIRRGLKFDAIVEIARQVLKALRQAHSLDIVHRDLKPENVLLSFRHSSEEQVVKVLDFGIAKLLHGESDDSGKGRLFGTPAYMSPEQCRGESETIGPMADIYAFGCVFYEMVCGSLPFPHDDPKAMVRAHLYDEVPEVRPRQGLEVPEGVASFITTCLQKEPSERFASAREALDVLEETVRQSGVPFGSGLTVQNDGHVQRNHGEQSRKVEVPGNRVTGADLDPIGEDAESEVDP
ncbi:MAG: serine/threonine protein kinase, partial [Bradymonadaceae bacterium]